MSVELLKNFDSLKSYLNKNYPNLRDYINRFYGEQTIVEEREQFGDETKAVFYLYNNNSMKGNFRISKISCVTKTGSYQAEAMSSISASSQKELAILVGTFYSNARKSNKPAALILADPGRLWRSRKRFLMERFGLLFVLHQETLLVLNFQHKK
jgi:hypothetical protein